MKHKSELIEHKLVQNEFLQTLAVIRELDFCDAHTFPLVYGFKKLDAEDDIKTSQEIVEEFYSGTGDPKVFAKQE